MRRPAMTHASSASWTAGPVRYGCGGPPRRGLEIAGIVLAFIFLALVGFRGVGSASCDQGSDERAKQGFAATACVVHELEEAQIERQLLLRDPPVRAEPGAQQGPEPLDRVDVHLAEPVPVLVAGVLAAPVADRLVLI